MEPIPNRPAWNATSGPARISAVLLLANRLDADALADMLRRSGRLGRIDTAVHEQAARNLCEQRPPHLLLVDPLACENVIQCTTTFLRSRIVRHVIVLDNRIREARVANLLPISNVSYLTREDGYLVLENAMIQVTISGSRTLSPAIAERVRRTTRGWRLEPAHAQSITRLTDRELQVMQLLAEGLSVRDCAKRLQLATSTVDNHKTRLMKKLRVHKTTELTHMAIRDGLITV